MGTKMKHLFAFLVFLFFSLASPLWAAITFDAATTGENSSSATNTVSFDVTVGTGSNRILYVVVAIEGDRTVSTLTYNGVAVGSQCTNALGANTGALALHSLVAPATGTNTLTVTVSSNGRFAVAVVSYAGVHQTTPWRAALATATGAASTPTVNVSSATGDLVVDGLIWKDTADTPTVGASQTERATKLITGQTTWAGASEEAGQTTVTMSWSTPDVLWGICAGSLQPAAASGPRDTVTGIIFE